MHQATANRLAFKMVWFAVLLELTVSANLLTWAGIPYVSEGGSLLVKLHPGTDLLAAGFGILLAGRGGWSVLARDRPLLLFFAAMTACLAYAAALTGVGNLIVLLDTFLPAGLLALILSQASAGQLGKLRRLMQTLIAGNAALAVVETAMQFNVVPLYLNEAAYHALTEDFRPTALFDHPLTASVMTMLGLALAPTRGAFRIVYLGLMWAALVAYGGRMAVAAALAMLGVGFGVRTTRLVLRKDSRGVSNLAAAAAVVGAGGLMVGIALAAGFGTRLSGHLYWDSSAQVRLAQWQLLDKLDCWQLLFGTRRGDLLALLTPLWLGPGVEVIENFWLLMFAGLGVAGFPLFVLGLAALLCWCWRRSALEGRLLVLAVMLVASTSNSLGRKSNILICLVAGISCIPGRRASACRTRRPAALPQPGPVECALA